MTETGNLRQSQPTNDDKLWAGLAYAFSPLSPILILALEEKRQRPFIRTHALQSLLLGLFFYAIIFLSGPFLIGLCMMPFGWTILLLYAYKAYRGELFSLPVITNFLRSQDWA